MAWRPHAETSEYSFLTTVSARQAESVFWDIAAEMSRKKERQNDLLGRPVCPTGLKLSHIWALQALSTLQAH
jgi:hypothetical protein